MDKGSSDTGVLLLLGGVLAVPLPVAVAVPLAVAVSVARLVKSQSHSTEVETMPKGSLR